MTLRGVYGCFYNGNILYIGSSGKTLEELSENHFQWKTKWGESGRTKFRENLINLIQDQIEFKWLVEPADRSLIEVECLEGVLIRAFLPPMNVDKDPVRSSKRYGRYK